MPTGKEKGELKYNETYPYLLTHKLPDYEVISKHRRTNDTTKQLAKQCIADDIELIKPDIMVVHLGIVDCAPRVFSRFQNALIHILPTKISKPIVGIVSKYRYQITKHVRKVYVNKQSFERNIEEFVKISLENDIKLILVSILRTNEKNKSKSFGFEENIEEYNSIIGSVAEQNNIPLIKYPYPNNFLFGDGIHINQAGSLFLCIEICKIIKNTDNQC